MGGGVKEELHTKGVNNRTVDLQWVVVWLRGVPLPEEWSWTGGELVVGARGFGGWIKK